MRIVRCPSRGGGGSRLAAISAFPIASRAFAPIPITSPVLCMNGPSVGSTPRNFVVLNAGAFTATPVGADATPDR